MSEIHTTPLRLPELLSRGDVAKLFRVCDATVTNWMKSKRLPAPFVYVGHRPYWTRDLLDTIRKGKPVADEPAAPSAGASVVAETVGA